MRNQTPVLPSVLNVKLGLKLSNAAYRELFKHNMDLFDVLDILENGYDCERSKRKALSNAVRNLVKKHGKLLLWKASNSGIITLCG